MSQPRPIISRTSAAANLQNAECDLLRAFGYKQGIFGWHPPGETVAKTFSHDQAVAHYKLRATTYSQDAIDYPLPPISKLPCTCDDPRCAECREYHKPYEEYLERLQQEGYIRLDTVNKNR